MTPDSSLDGLLRWRCIGPFRGGRVVAVAGSYSDRNTFYFGGCAGGVWKTVDAGTYWRNVSDGFFTTSSVGAIAVAPSDSNVIYAGTGETTIRIDVSHGDGVYKSSDEGRTWTNVGLRDTRHIGKIRVHPHDPDTVWVAALGHAFGPNKERGVFKSTDGGAIWRQVLFVSEKAGAVDLTVDPANPRVLYAGVWEAYRSFWQISSGGPDSGLWQSLDGGETWQNISNRFGLPKPIWGKVGVAASGATPGRAWVLIEHEKEGGLYRTDDLGQTWEKVSEDQNLLSRAWYYTHLTADPQDGETVYVNNLDLHKSSDGGRTFVKIPTPHGDNHDLWIDPLDNTRMVQGNDGGANVSLNGGYTFSSIYNQPTAQFYHLATDNRDPYFIYGTQQDNSSLAVPSAVNHGAITWGDCFVAGTGESGYIAVHPADPDVVYVGAIGSSPGGGNSLQRYDRKRNQIRLITTWPEGERGRGAKEHKYRFAWTYPIVISPHDPDTLYIGGNFVFKSTDEGQSWQQISPDLTRADPETLEPSGGPINLDAVGAEVYATVFAFAESPHEAGVLWAGSDDGLMHISRNGGKDWTDITPKLLPERSLISCIELSPFEPGVAYIAATRYKLDDYAPYLFVTRNYGRSWRRINKGIPDDDFTRVIRADPEQEGLLYAGTETGIYTSFDDGANWQRLQLNLPVAPIHELLVKGTDLIAGTHGRSIWILDDLTPLRVFAAGNAQNPDGPPPTKKGRGSRAGRSAGGGESTAGQPTQLFAPRAAVRVLPDVDWTNDIPGWTNYLGSIGAGFLTEVTPDGEKRRTFLDAGENPPRGAIIAYSLAEAPAEPISLVIRNAKGEEIRTFSSRKEDDPPKAKELRAPANAGGNRFVWDLRHAPVTKIEGSDPIAEEPIPGPFVPPGEYTVTLTVGESELTQPFTVRKPAVVDISGPDLEAQYDLSLRISLQLDRTAKTINRMRDLRAQLDGLAKRTKERDGAGEIAAAAEEIREHVLEMEKLLAVPDLRPGWADGINAGARLLEKLSGLPDVVHMGDYRPTDAAEEAYRDMTDRIEAVIADFDKLVQAELADLNASASAAAVPVTIVMEQERKRE
jgi:photosystem II stability/assembly factor-like uncharacterized protein